jgi:hypothetical protein
LVKQQVPHCRANPDIQPVDLSPLTSSTHSAAALLLTTAKSIIKISLRIAAPRVGFTVQLTFLTLLDERSNVALALLARSADALGTAPDARSVLTNGASYP